NRAMVRDERIAKLGQHAISLRANKPDFAGIEFNSSLAPHEHHGETVPGSGNVTKILRFGTVADRTYGERADGAG
ncbi:hypothetical protein, partial [Enterobacter cloacae]|uniref:hypothetical protein n=1 Tax=Enterobacter cloacae TaxID=550 RepID=UPI0013D4DB27